MPEHIDNDGQEPKITPAARITEINPKSVSIDFLSTYVTTFSGSPWHEDLDFTIARNRLIKKTTEADGYLLEMMTSHGVVGGAQFYGLADHTETAKQMPSEHARDMYLSEVWVVQERRGLGLGTRLLESIEQAVASLSYRRIVLRTHPDYPPLLNFYRDRGYVKVGMSDPGDGTNLRPVFSKPIFAVRRRAA